MVRKSSHIHSAPLLPSPLPPPLSTLPPSPTARSPSYCGVADSTTAGTRTPRLRARARWWRARADLRTPCIAALSSSCSIATAATGGSTACASAYANQVRLSSLTAPTVLFWGGQATPPQTRKGSSTTRVPVLTPAHLDTLAPCVPRVRAQSTPKATSGSAPTASR